MILDSLSKDGQFIALQQSDIIIFYATVTLKQIFPRGTAPAAFTNAATCIVPYNAVRNYCIHWSPAGHRAAYGVDIGKEIYLRLFDPAGVEKERLFRLRDNLNKRPFTRFVKWSPGSEFVAVMTNIFADGDSSSRRISIDIYGISGTSYPSISENIAYEGGEGIIVLAEWCKPDVMLFVEATSRTFTTYDVSRKRLEKSTIKFEDDTSVLRKYFSEIPACQ